jgi:hypothetical protein
VIHADLIKGYHEQLREFIPSGLSMNSLSKHDINQASKYDQQTILGTIAYEASLIFLNEKVLQLNRLTHLAHLKLAPILR